MNIKKLFSRPEEYTKYNPTSPAEKAQRVWDERDGEIIIQNYNLRRLNIGQLVVNIVLAGVIAFLSTKSSVQPYVVFANPDNGAVWHVGTVQAAKDFEPNEQIKKYFMANFLKEVREVPLDPVVHNKNLRNALGYMTRDASEKLKTQMAQENQNRDKQATVTINIQSINPIENSQDKSSYQVRWTEDEFAIGSGQKTTTTYTGVFTTTMIKSKDEQQIEINPIGFYITDFNYSKDAASVNQPKSGQAKKQ